MIKSISNQQNSQERPDPIRKKYEEVAEGFEAQFIDHLFTEMEKSVDRQDPMGQAEGIYSSFLNFERAQIASKQNGLGLKKLILDQIYPQHLTKKIIANNDINNIGGQKEGPIKSGVQDE